MPVLLPSGLNLALLGASIEHDWNWFSCPDGHFWYWAAAPEMGSPLFDKEEGAIRAPAHAKAPRTREEAKQFVYVLEMKEDGSGVWRGEWLADFPKYRALSEGDRIAWEAWINKPETGAYLDRIIEECSSLAKKARHTQGAFLASFNPLQAIDAKPFTKVLGEHPESGEPVTIRRGQFGPYVQLGEQTNGGETPKRSGLPKGIDLNSVDLKYALALLSLPREVGKHPKSGKPILSGIGRHGSYIQHYTNYVSLGDNDDVLTIGIDRAVTLLAEKIARDLARDSKTLGEHPEFGGPVTLHRGRFGPYVTHNKINASIPNASGPKEITLDQAVALIAERTAKMRAAAPKKKP